jgi:prepilin-type N-terminal cleavage/methylation domain-containing protein
MKTNRRKSGFTLIELLLVITIVAMLAAGAYAGYGALMLKTRAKDAATQASTIHKWLVAYSLDGGGAFPISEKSSNEAFRELFKRSFGADEMQFYIPGDPYHNPAKDHKPDGDTGRAPDFAQALETGECAFSYVSGLTQSDEGRFPFLPMASDPLLASGPG